MPVNEDPPSRPARATLRYRAASALRLRGLIKVTLCLVVHSAVAQCLALRTAKDIFDLVVLKLVTREVPMRLVASIESPEYTAGYFALAITLETLHCRRPYP